MQTLKLADDLFAKMDSGRKTGTVRLGHQTCEFGPLQIVSVQGTVPARTVEVSRVVFKTAGDLSEADAALDGDDSVADLLAVLHRFYPTMDADDDVTVISFA